MRPLVRKITNLILLSALLALQVHVLFHKHMDEHGKADDDCQLCATVLTQKATAAVTVATPSPVYLSFSFISPPQPKVVFSNTVALPALRGPPAILQS